MTKSESLYNLLKDFDYDKNAAIDAIWDYDIQRQSLKRSRVSSLDRIAVSLQSVDKKYQLRSGNVNVLSDVSLDIYEGEFVAIVGTSGSGKSTLLNLIGGLDKPTSGTVKIYQHDISQLPDSKLARLRNQTIGFIFQSFYLQPFLNIKKNVAVPGMFGRSERLERTDQVDKLLELVGLSGYEEYYPRQLSGGQMQRVAISRALMNNPKIILADEPTGNLDSRNSRAIIEIFENLRKEYNVTIVLVTHDKQIASRADRVLLMKDGRLS